MFSRECPSHEEGLELLRRAGREAGVELDLTVREVLDDEEAERLRFPGSPTYLLRGTDVAATPQGVPFRADACRAYERPGGRVGPLPHLDDLVAALKEHAP
ncbi:MAG: hypothetical protein QOK40_2714 [Miltoncostaeaceae bacterium]|jgi:hypothetical protein|nr:hypothetical protein [Miltoncostaeaceae bacterium]